MSDEDTDFAEYAPTVQEAGRILDEVVDNNIEPQDFIDIINEPENKVNEPENKDEDSEQLIAVVVEDMSDETDGKKKSMKKRSKKKSMKRRSKKKSMKRRSKK